MSTEMRDMLDVDLPSFASSHCRDVVADRPGALPMPLQSIISEKVLRRIDVLAEKGHPGVQALATSWVNQGVCQLARKRPAREAVLEMAEGYLPASERLAGSLG